jgi:hypothetical protein
MTPKLENALAILLASYGTTASVIATATATARYEAGSRKQSPLTRILFFQCCLYFPIVYSQKNRIFAKIILLYRQ